MRVLTLYPLAGILAPAIAIAVVAAVLGHPPERVMASFVLVTLLSALALTDATTQTVPDGLSFPLILCGLVYSGAMGQALGLTLVLVGALVATALLMDWIAPDRGWIGSGDYLLLAGALAWLGPRAMPDLIMLGAVLLGLQAVITRARMLAMAPAFAIAITVLWLGEPIP